MQLQSQHAKYFFVIADLLVANFNFTPSTQSAQTFLQIHNLIVTSIYRFHFSGWKLNLLAVEKSERS